MAPPAPVRGRHRHVPEAARGRRRRPGPPSGPSPVAAGLAAAAVVTALAVAVTAGVTAIGSAAAQPLTATPVLGSPFTAAGGPDVWRTPGGSRGDLRRPSPVLTLLDHGARTDRPAPRVRVRPAPPRPAAHVVVRASTSVLALVRRAFPAREVGNAIAVVTCESDQQWWQEGPVNHDGSRDWGLFQLNDGGTLQGALARIGVPYRSADEARALALDPVINTRAAVAIWRDRGWSPWVCAYTQGIVAALWSNAPGPMAGRYDVGGRPLVLSPPSRRPVPRPVPRPQPRRTPAPAVPAPVVPAPTTPAPVVTTPAPSDVPTPDATTPPASPAPVTTAGPTTSGSPGGT